jgi:hypothetical protein
MTMLQHIVASGGWRDFAMAAVDGVAPQILGALAWVGTMLMTVHPLLAERQRWVAMDQLLRRVPEGSVIVLQRSGGLPAIWIWVGGGPGGHEHG